MLWKENTVSLHEMADIITAGLYPGDIDWKHLRRWVHEFQIYNMALENRNKELLRTIKQMKEQTHRYSIFFHAAPHAFFILNNDGIIQEINTLAAEFLRKHSHELKGRCFPELLHSDSVPEFLSAFRQSREHGRLYCKVKFRFGSREGIVRICISPIDRESMMLTVTEFVSSD